MNRVWMGFDRLSPNGSGLSLNGIGLSPNEWVCRRVKRYFQAGLLGLSLAVATFCGHTTSNSPFCH